MDFTENKTIENVKKIDKLELRKSIDNFQFYDPEKQVNLIKLTGSPKPIASPRPSLIDKRDPTYSDNIDEFKNLSASSIQSQLENTIRLNNRQIPAAAAAAVPLIKTETPETKPLEQQQPLANEPVTIQTNLTPPKGRTYKRPRKSSSGISPGSNTVVTPVQQQQPSNTFSLDMNDIFETVLSNANKDSEAEPNPESQKNSSITLHSSKNNGVLPISFHLLKPSDEMKTLAVPTPSFDDDLSNQETYMAQENSHLIQFDRCLLGCVFFIKASEDYYADDCIQDWRCVIEKFGGRVVDSYDNYNSEITHVLASDRYSDIYKKVII